jgi:hypothetical protein
MSTTSIKIDREVRPALGDSQEVGGRRAGDARRGRSLPDVGSLAGWRRQALETLVFLSVIAVLQRRFPGADEVPGLPNLYWLPVLLASCQYGVSGGMIATFAASVVYLFGLTPQSAAQDFYTYGRIVAIQPAAWLATALVLGGLRSLHIHQYSELADQLAASRRRGSDLSDGVERATAEISALERRIAVDMSSVASFTRSLSQLDMSDRRTAAMRFAELFRVGAGSGTFAVYLKDEDGYTPVWAVEEHSPRSTNSMESLPASAVTAMLIESARNGASDDAGEGTLGAKRLVVAVPPAGVGAEPLAAIVCELKESQDLGQFRRRAEELGRMFATILFACPSSPSEARS